MLLSYSCLTDVPHRSDDVVLVLRKGDVEEECPLVLLLALEERCSQRDEQVLLKGVPSEQSSPAYLHRVITPSPMFLRALMTLDRLNTFPVQAVDDAIAFST